MGFRYLYRDYHFVQQHIKVELENCGIIIINDVPKPEIPLKTNKRALQLAKLASGVAKFWNVAFWGQVRRRVWM